MINFDKFYLYEMPHLVVNNVHFDYRLEKPNWVNNFISILKQNSNNLDKVLAPFYELYGKLFKKRYLQLSQEDKEKLDNYLPVKFLEDILK